MSFFKNIKSNNYGFTLAEVLITLVIIGVIAAMTIPTLMKNTQNQEFVTGLKKAQSTLQQALIIMARNNDSSPGDYSFLNGSNFVPEFAKATNVLKKCNSTADCFAGNLHNGGVYKYLNNTNLDASDTRAVLTADGQAYSFAVLASNTGTSGLATEDRANLVGRIFVDINGQKGPNVVGRDFFLFYIVNGKGAIPAGITSQTDCVKTSGGMSCAGRVLKENAMNY